MTMDYRAAQSVVEGAAALREAIPDVIKGYGALSVGTYKQGALDPKTKELIALALAIGARCDGCVAYHAKAAHDKGASREEVAEVIGVAIHMAAARRWFTRRRAACLRYVQWRAPGLMARPSLRKPGP